MSFFQGIKTKKALSRLQEEQVYEYILDEIELGKVRRGLMAKAITRSNGDESKWQSEYIKLRFQSLLDENTIFEAIKEIQSKNNSSRSNTTINQKKESFTLKPIKKGNKASFWDSLKEEFMDARRKDRDID